ncbi:MAG: response regulator transcription factor [Deinococcota bacterium]
MTQPIRVLVVDDHEIVREGLMTLLEDEQGVAVVGGAASGQEALELATSLSPDVVLMDMALPDATGIDVTKQVRAAHPKVQVIILTGNFGAELRVRDAMQAGAVGYLLKDILKDDLVHAIHRAAEGKPTLHPEAQEQLVQVAVAEPEAHSSLTGRELDVLKLIGQGLSNKKIASTLDLTEGTVKGYVSIVLSKLNVSDRTQAALYAVKHNLS